MDTERFKAMAGAGLNLLRAAQVDEAVPLLLEADALYEEVVLGSDSRPLPTSATLATFAIRSAGRSLAFRSTGTITEPPSDIFCGSLAPTGETARRFTSSRA